MALCGPKSGFRKRLDPEQAFSELRRLFQGSSAFTNGSYMLDQLCPAVINRKVHKDRGNREVQKDRGRNVSYSPWYPAVPHMPQGLSTYLYMSELVLMVEIAKKENHP